MFKLKRKVSIPALAAVVSACLLGASFLDEYRAYGEGTDKQAGASGGEHYTVAPGVDHRGEILKLETAFRFSSKADQGKHKGQFDSGSELIENVNIAKIDFKNPAVSLKVVTPNGRVNSFETVTNLAKKYDREGHKVVAGFNLTSSYKAGMAQGLLIVNGEILTSPPGPLQTAFRVLPDGTAKVGGDIEIKSIFRAMDGETLNLDGVNKYREGTLTNHAFILSDKLDLSLIHI